MIATMYLNNGLRVVHTRHPQAALCAVEVLYRVGSRDEDAEATGLAHLFEHLMFSGTEAVPQFDAPVEAAGGINNAATSADYTYFYEVLPLVNIETAFWLESDRMRGLAFSPEGLEVQRSVVVEEFKQTHLNTPYGGVTPALLGLLYGDGHPYGWPVIGKTPDHVQHATMQQVKDWFYSHYAPNNAILSVCADLPEERVRELAEKWFGPVPAREIAPRRELPAVWLEQERRVEISDRVPQTLVAMAYGMDPFGTPGYLAADAISDILSNGKSTRLPQRVVREQGIATHADACISGLELPGYFLLTATIAGTDPEAEERVIAELKRQVEALAEPGNVTAEELERAKNVYESSFVMGLSRPRRKAHELAMAENFGEDINTRVNRYRALTLEQIAAEARRLFVDHAPAIVICRPK